jgi:cell division initiation protein
MADNPQEGAPQGRPADPPKSAIPRRARRRSALDEIRDVNFPFTLRGYDRAAVDAYVTKVSQLVAELEATQLRESVIQRALDEVGEQTSGILQHAHDTAEEVAARSRAQAEGRVQRAQREAEAIRHEAEKEAALVMRDAQRLWEERRQLIDDLRHFADDVLALADDALERLPEPGAEDEDEGATSAGKNGEGDGSPVTPALPADPPAAPAARDGGGTDKPDPQGRSGPS